LLKWHYFNSVQISCCWMQLWCHFAYNITQKWQNSSKTELKRHLCIHNSQTQNRKGIQELNWQLVSMEMERAWWSVGALPFIIQSDRLSADIDQETVSFHIIWLVTFYSDVPIGLSLYCMFACCVRDIATTQRHWRHLNTVVVKAIDSAIYRTALWPPVDDEM